MYFTLNVAWTTIYLENNKRLPYILYSTFRDDFESPQHASRANQPLYG